MSKAKETKKSTTAKSGSKASSSSKAKKKKNLPRTVQQTLGYEEAYPKNGVIQIAPGVFSKVFRFKDISFKTLSDEDQEQLYEQYEKFLNSLNPDEDIFFTIVNSKGDKTTGVESILPIDHGDEFDVYRREMSKMIRDKFESSRNNIVTRKYITVVIKENDVARAMKKLQQVGSEIENNFKKITKDSINEVGLAERLEIMSTILRGDHNYWFEHDINGNTTCDFEAAAKQGYTTKDIISPEVLKFKGNSFQCGEDRFGQSMYLDRLANWMNTNFLSDISEVNFESVVTLHINAMPQNQALKAVHNQAVNISAEVIQKQQHMAKEGIYNENMLPAALKNAQDQIQSLQDDLMNRDQKMFFSSLIVTHFAESEDQLKINSKVIKEISEKYMSSVQPLMMQQERGLKSSLLLGRDDTFVRKTLTTEALGIFIPFNEANTMDKGGFYYGVNSVNKSIIVCNRCFGMNYNGLVLGASGSGKSFSAKREMSSAILQTNADVYIIDPDGEYTPIAEAFNGTVVKIAPGNGVYINPFDLDTDTSHDNDSNPIAMKMDFICGMLETMMGSNAVLTPTQKSIVDRCVRQIYTPYLEHLQQLPLDPKTGKRPTIDRAYCPTMQSLFDALLSQPQPEAQNLALIMESYTTGTYDTFAHRTNVDLDTRVVVYDIRGIGTNLMELGLKVCMNDVWNKIMENRRLGKWTWFYIDEFHLLLNNASTAEFLKSVWKRARKWQGVPTGITQNVEDLLNSPAARAIINNSSFVYMLNQSLMDREMLKELLHLSDNDMEFVTNVDSGRGLIKTGKSVIPFEDKFPNDTKLFQIMTTKPKDAEQES